MDTYGKRLDAALAAKTPKDRAWLAAQLGVTVQALSQVIIGKTKALTAENHELAVQALGCSGIWLATGKGEMLQSGVIPPEYKQNQPLASVQQTQAAINGVASLDVTLNNLSAYLAQAEAGRSDVVGPMLAALAKNPDDQALIGAIKMLLTPSGFAETQRKAA